MPVSQMNLFLIQRFVISRSDGNAIFLYIDVRDIQIRRKIEPLSLSEGIKPRSFMLSDDVAVLRDDISGFFRQFLLKEFLDRYVSYKT